MAAVTVWLRLVTFSSIVGVIVGGSAGLIVSGLVWGT